MSQSVKYVGLVHKDAIAVALGGGQPGGARASGDDEAARQASGRKSIFTFATMPGRAATTSRTRWPPLAIAASWSRHR
jgi:hypothetical protein